MADFPVDVSETVSGSEALTESYGTSEGFSERDVSVSEVLLVSYGVSGPETVSASESLSESYAASETIPDRDVAVSDSLLASYGTLGTGSETVSASESLSESYEALGSGPETVSASESLSESYAASEAIPDRDVAVSESLSESYGVSEAGSETVSASGVLAENYSAIVTAAASYSVNSVVFDGVDEHVTMGDVLGFERTDAFSVSLWTKSTQTGVEANFFSKCGDGPNYRGYLLNQDDIDDSLVFYLINTWPTNCIEVRPTQLVNDGQWHHVVIAYDGSSQASGISVYIDGVAVSFTTLKNTLSATILTPTPLQFGRRASAGLPQPYAGSLDEVSIWDKKLSESDVVEVYNGGSPADLAQHSSTSNLVGWWRMGEGSVFPVILDLGSGGVPYPLVQDLSGNGYDGTMMNMEVTDVTSDAPYGKCVVFDGVNEYVDAGNILNFEWNTPFTCSHWIKTPMTGGFPAGYSNYLAKTYNSRGYQYVVDNNRFGCTLLYAPGEGLSALTLDSFTTSEWNHVVVTYDGSGVNAGLTIYVNGVARAVFNAHDNLAGRTIITDRELNFGRRTYDYYLNGRLDEIAFWNKELSAAEVAELYNEGGLLAATETSFVDSLIAYWPMGENDTFPTLRDRRLGAELSAIYPTIVDARLGTDSATYPTILDASGSGFNGTMTNMAVNDIVLDSPGGTFSKFALDFDGVNDYVNMGNVLGFERTDSFTISFWMKTSSAANDKGIICKSAAGTYRGYELTIYNGHIILSLISTLSTNWLKVSLSDMDYRDGVWRHFVFTYNGSSAASGVSCYVNGVVKVLTVVANTLSATIMASSSLLFASRFTTAGYNNARLNDIAIYNDVLTPLEITAIYNGGTPTDNRLLSSAANLVGYWRMGDQVRFDGTMTNMAVNDIVLDSPGGTFSKFALDFDGSNDYVGMGDILNFDFTDAFTFSMWIKFTTAGYSHILTKMATGIWKGYQFTTSLGTLGFNLQSSNAVGIGTYPNGPYNDGNWHHVVITYDGSTVAAGTHWYIDSVDTAYNIAFDNYASVSMITSQVAYIAKRADGYPYPGKITDLTVYDKALSPAEVAEVYNAGVPTDNRLLSSAANLVGYWRMGDQVRFDGTMTNMEAEDIEDRAVNSALAFSKKSLAFGGTNEYVTMGDVLGYEYTDAFSYSFWVKTSGSTGGYLVSKMEDAPNYRGYGANRLAGGTLRLHFISIDASNKLTVDTTATVHDGKWHHVVVTYDGSATPSGVACYIDTVPSGLTTVQNNLSGTILTPASFNIVGRGDGTWGLTVAIVDEVSVWGKKLSATEVADIYNMGVPKDLSSYADLDGYWRLGDSVPNDGLMVNMEIEDIQADAPLISAPVEVSESLLAFQGIEWNTSDTVAVSENLVHVQSFTTPVSEVVPFSETIGADTPTKVNESVSVSESVDPQYGYRVQGGDPILLTESLTVGRGDSRNVSDTVLVSDSVEEAHGFGTLISESVSVSDSLWSGTTGSRSVSESVTISESLLRDTVLTLVESVGISETQTQHASMASQLSDVVRVLDDVDATRNDECRVETLPGGKEQQPFRLGLHDELSWSPRGAASSFTHLKFEPIDGGVPLRVLEVEREYSTFQTGNSGYLVSGDTESVDPSSSHLFNFPGDVEYLSYDPIGKYLEVTAGYNQGIYKIKGLKYGTGPIVLELDRFLPLMDPPNGYIQGILELVGSHVDHLGIVYEYRFNPAKVTLVDPLLELISYDLRGASYPGTLVLSSTPNIMEFRPRLLDDPLVTFDPSTTLIFALARVSPKVDWKLISGITSLSVLTTKPTAGKSYRVSAESMQTSDGRYVDITGYTFIRLTDIQSPRVIWAGSVGDDGTILVQFDQPMQPDAANLFNPSDYVISGPTPVEVTRVSAYNPTTVALTTTGISSGDYTLTVSTSTPKDPAGNPLDPTYNTAIFTASLPLALRSIFTDKGPIAKPPLTLLSGATATISSFTEITITGAALTSSHVGKYLTLTGASSNSGTFRITAVPSTTRARVQASFTLPDVTVFSWEVFDPRDGLMADDPADVTVRVNGVPVTPEAVVGLLGQVVLNSAPAESDDVKVDYSWCCNPTVDFRRLNSKEFRLNAWNRDQGYPHDSSQHHYRYNNVLVRPSDYRPLDPRATLDQPVQRELHYRAYERAYTPVLNDPSTLVLNTPIHRIAYPPSQRYLSEEYVTYEGLALPEGQLVNPWTRRGSGTASVAGGYLTIEDDTSGPYPNGKPLFWTRLIDLTFPLVFAMSWRFKLDTLTELDGVFSGIVAGYSDDKVAIVVGFLEDGGVKKIGILKRDYGDDPSSLVAWVGGLDSLGSATGLPVEFDWTDLHSYRILKDRNGVIRVFVDGELDPILQVLPDEVPFLEELNAPFDEIQGAFFGSLSRSARSVSKWDFVRYLIQPTNPVQTSASSFVSYEANVVPEEDAKPWTLVGFHGTETILSTDFLLLDSTSASDATGVGLIGGDYRGYFRFEPLLTVSSELVVDAKFQGVTQTHGISPNGLMFAVDDGSRLMQVSFLLEREAPKISYGGRSLPEDFTPYVWSSMGTQTAAMAGRVLRITDASDIDGLVYYYDDLYPAGSAERVVAAALDYVLEFRCRVLSYTVEANGFAGAFGQVFDGSRSVGLLLREVAGVKYVTFQSDGAMLADAAFDWGDGAPHTYRLTKSTVGDLVSLFVDGQFVDSLAYSSFAATGPSTTGQVTFGSSTPASNGSLSVVDWYYCNAWRLLSGLRSYVGLWKGTNTSTLLDYHLPLKVTGRDATAVANALGDGNAAFLSAGVVPGDILIVDDGPNTGVYEVAGVPSETSLTLTAAWAQQPTLVTYRIVRETDWSVQHKYRLTRDSQGNVALLLDAGTNPLIRVGYNSIDLPPTGASGIRIISGGLPAIVFGAFDSGNLSQSNWDYVRYGLTRAPNELRIVPHHEVMNQWNVMHSPERLFTQLAHTLTDFKSSSTGQPPKTEPDFLADIALEAFTKLNEGTPLVPLTQTFEVRAPYPTTEFISALNRPEDVLNSDADFTLNDASVRYRLIVPKDILYSSLDVIEQTAGEPNLIAPFSDGCFCMPDVKLEYTKDVCLTYDGDVLPEDDTAASTPWHLVNDNPSQVSTSIFGGVLTFSTNAGGTKAAYLNNTPLPDAPSLRTEAQFRMRVLADGTLGTGDTQIRAGLSAPGVTVALAFVTTPLAERFILVMDLNNGNVLGSITFDFLDGAYHTYRIVRDPGAGVVQVAIDI